MGEERGCKEFRKHIAWYLKGFRAGGEVRAKLGLVSTLDDLDRLLTELDSGEAFPLTELGAPVAGRAARARWPSRKGGSTTVNTAVRTRVPSWESPAAEP